MADYLRSSVAVLQGRMETSDERRKRRLGQLCQQYGGVRSVAQESGVAWATLDQILKGTLLPAKEDGTRSPRALGDANARAIEDALKLGRGWFDWPFDNVDFKAYASLSEVEKGYVQARMVAAIEECAAKHAKRVLRGLGVKGEPVSNEKVEQHYPRPPSDEAEAVFNRASRRGQAPKKPLGKKSA
jgi:hypothetical protein